MKNQKGTKVYNSQNMLTTTQAANALGVSRGRILQLIAGGRLLATLFSRVWMIDPESVIKFERRKPGRRPNP